MASEGPYILEVVVSQASVCFELVILSTVHPIDGAALAIFLYLLVAYSRSI